LLDMTKLLTMDDSNVFGALLATVKVLDIAVLLEPVVLLGMGELLATAAAATAWLDELLVAAELADKTVSGLMGELLATAAAATAWLDELLVAAELADKTVSELMGELVGELMGELMGELLAELLTDVRGPASVVVLLREATDALPEGEAASRVLTAGLLEGSVVELLVDRIARLVDGAELPEGLGELWEELAEFDVKLSVLEAIEELAADVVMLLINNLFGEALSALVVKNPDELEEETTPVQLPKAD
jgi:hypothetical protein